MRLKRRMRRLIMISLRRNMRVKMKNRIRSWRSMRMG